MVLIAVAHAGAEAFQPRILLLQERIIDIAATTLIEELEVKALEGDLDDIHSFNEHVSYLEVAELWHVASNSMGLVILAHLPNDIYGVHDLLMYDEEFLFLARCIQSTGTNVGAPAYIQECNPIRSLCNIFHYAVADLTPRNLESIARLHTFKSKHGGVSMV